MVDATTKLCRSGIMLCNVAVKVTLEKSLVFKIRRKETFWRKLQDKEENIVAKKGNKSLANHPDFMKTTYTLFGHVSSRWVLSLDRYITEYHG